MAQTPKSASVIYSSTTPTTIYTVPGGATAVVKGVLASSSVANFDTVTLNKVSGGVTYPLARSQQTGYAAYTSSTYYPAGAGQVSVNLLASPITLAAGDSISISSADTSYYKVATATYSSNWKIGNIAYLNGYYVVVGQDTSTGNGLILTSTDGITYTQRTFSYAFYLSNVTYGNGYYVVCNTTGGAVHYSTDLVTWTAATLPSTVACYAITYGNGKFVVGGAGGYYYYATTTPVSWTAATRYNSSSIQSIAYIGTNYFYGTNGISYYTADFSTYTQPYVFYDLSVSSASIGGYGGFTVSGSVLLACNSLIASINPNTFMRTSSNGVTWSNVTTTTNNLITYYSQPTYFRNGAYIVNRYYNTSTNYYLYSPDGTTWTQGASGISNATGTGQQIFRAAYDNSTSATYNNKMISYMYSSAAYQFSCNDVTTSGNYSTSNFSFSASTNGPNTTFGQVALLVGNPYDGSWIGVAYYTSGGTYQCPFWYGASYNSGSDGQFNSGVYVGTACGYGTSAGVIPNSANFLIGTTNGWVLYGSYSSVTSTLIGNPSVGAPVPTGITWSAISGSAVAGIARSGDTSTSILAILWANGQIATSTNQGSSFTQVGIGASGFGFMAQYGQSPIQYNNGKFYAINIAGLVLTSSDGLTWATMLSGVESIYNLNSQNVFITTSGILTSATGNVTTFTNKTSTSYAGNPATNRLTYVGSTYYLASPTNSLYSSSDLITWTSKTFNGTQINDTTYFSASYAGLAYSGSGTAIVVSSAYSANSTNSSGYVAKAFTPSASIVIGNATASIVEIT